MRDKELGKQLMQIMQKLNEHAVECAKDLPSNYGDHMRRRIELENELANVFSDAEKKPMQAKSWNDGVGTAAVVWDVDKEGMH